MGAERFSLASGQLICPRQVCIHKPTVLVVNLAPSPQRPFCHQFVWQNLLRCWKALLKLHETTGSMSVHGQNQSRSCLMRRSLLCSKLPLSKFSKPMLLSQFHWCLVFMLNLALTFHFADSSAPWPLQIILVMMMQPLSSKILCD